MAERSRRLRILRRSAVVLALVVATMAPAAAPVAANAQIAPRAADGAEAPAAFNVVRTAQRFLSEQTNPDYQPGPVDGIEGPRTRAAVMAWQRDNDLEPTGMLNLDTLSSMGLAPD